MWSSLLLQTTGMLLAYMYLIRRSALLTIVMFGFRYIIVIIESNYKIYNPDLLINNIVIDDAIQCTELTVLDMVMNCFSATYCRGNDFSLIF